MKRFGLEKYYDLPLVQKASKATKQPPHLIVAGVILFITILVFTPIGSLITTSITFLMPAYKTFKALETKELKDDKRMLTFWICFGFLFLFDSLLSRVFGFLYFYHVFRAFLIIYLYLP